MIELYPDGHLPPWLSVLIAVALVSGLAFLLLASLWRIFVHLADGHAADSVLDESSGLKVGAHLVAGVVELDEGVEFGARVEIEQQGSEHSDSEGHTSHVWKETRRRTFSRPFWIRHHSGERVLVEPASKVLLVDQLDRTVQDMSNRRFRIAELSAGENVIAEGRLEQARASSEQGAGYRDAAPLQWVLRPGEVERLHLSAEKLGGRHRRKARRIALMLLLGWLPATLIAGGLTSTFWARAVFGEPDEAVLSGKRTYITTDDEGDDTTHYVVDYEYSHGAGSEELDSDDWRVANVGDHTAMLDVPVWRRARALGASASMYWLAGLLGGVLIFMAVFALRRAKKRDWYEGKLEEKGGGRLPEPKPSNERVYSLEE